MATLGMYTADLPDAPSRSTEQARTGTYSFKSFASFTTAFSLSVPASSGTLYGRIACYFTNISSAVDFRMFDGSTSQTSIKISPYSISGLRTANDLLGQNPAMNIQLNTWLVFEFKVVVHDTAGEITVKLNGDTILNLTNVDTKYTANASISRLDIYHTGAATGYYDDIVFDDANWPGLGGIEVLLPTADGADTDWTGSYADVDEVTADDDTTYISTDAAVTGTRHTFTFADLVNGATVVPRVGLAARAKLDAAGSGTLNLRLNGNQPTGDGLSTSYQKFTKFWDVDPADSNAWSQAKVNAIEAGVSS